MTKLNEVINVATEYFLNSFYVGKDIMFLIGYFVDDDDIGYIFLDHNKEKVYVPSYVLFYFSPFNNKLNNEFIYGFTQDSRTNRITYLAKHNDEFYTLDFIHSKEELVCFAELLSNISNYIEDVLYENYSKSTKGN